MIFIGNPQQESTPRFSFEQCLEFECARECLTDMLSIILFHIATETRSPAPDQERLEKLQGFKSEIFSHRANLHVGDDQYVKRINSNYGAKIRAWYQQGIAVDAI